VIVPEPLIVNDSLEISGTVGIASGTARTEQDWQQQLSEEARAFNEAFIAWTPRQDGATINLPDPDGTVTPEPTRCASGFGFRISRIPSCRSYSKPASRFSHRHGTMVRAPPAHPVKRRASSR
jgi:hypothetical protein